MNLIELVGILCELLVVDSTKSLGYFLLFMIIFNSFKIFSTILGYYALCCSMLFLDIPS
jgi:hypothetical protein